MDIFLQKRIDSLKEASTKKWKLAHDLGLI